jgi:hypothetical protein
LKDSTPEEETPVKKESIKEQKARKGRGINAGDALARQTLQEYLEARRE